jgi:ATP-dependent DNA helicase HFM1/MER3
VRPVKLRTIVKGYAPTKTDFLFERRLNDYIYSVVSEHSKGKPSLVFCRWADLQCPFHQEVAAVHMEVQTDAPFLSNQQQRIAKLAC